MKMYTSYVIMTLFLVGCNLDKFEETKLNEDILALDGIFRSKEVNTKVIDSGFLEIRRSLNLTNGETMLDKGFKAEISWYWNADSSVVLITTNKTHAGGFTREVLLNIMDTSILVKTYAVFRGDPRDSMLTFLDEYSYCTESKTVRILNKVEKYSALQDTIRLKDIPYYDVAVEHDTDLGDWLQYARDIRDTQ